MPHRTTSPFCDRPSTPPTCGGGASADADADYHHEAADTVDKLNVRELKEYAGQLARLLLRLSHQPPEAWPNNPMTVEQVRQRLEEERGTVIRVY